MSTAATATRPAVPVLVQAMRPHQWTKNLLVLAAPIAAGSLGDVRTWSAVLAAFLMFCLASSAVYLANDCCDVEADRRHPTKRLRPIAAGAVSQKVAVGTAVWLTTVALVIAGLLGTGTLLLLLTYLTLQLAYVLVLKHEVVVDIAIVASGFLLRAIAGGVAAGIVISHWFLLVAGFGSLFIVAGKRFSELKTLGHEAQTRSTLTVYTESYLRLVLGISAGAMLMSYALWALEELETSSPPLRALSVAPFAVGILRYAVDVDAGLAEEAEDVILRDRPLVVIGLMWLALVTAGAIHG